MTVSPLLTQNELSRQLHITQSRLSRLLRNGGIEPDFITSQAKLFRPARLASISEQINVGVQ
jgi:predicted XRE-type DNA-binding protein